VFGHGIKLSNGIWFKLTQRKVLAARQEAPLIKKTIGGVLYVWEYEACIWTLQNGELHAECESSEREYV
jgi:hypothetical protein